MRGGSGEGVVTGTFVVNSEGSLRLRATPDSETGAVLGAMPRGTRVERIEGAPGDIWFKVKWRRFMGSLG
jgi:hypothetical protein